ncbi:MAG: BamA/TamA family outer membrane protein [Balneolaceae bacterium]|nr:BamA/TamA family outer membrane protein [Balneolaceae bacterium]
MGVSGEGLPAYRPEDDQVWKVVIEGNRTFKDLVLKQIIATDSPTFVEKLAFWNRGGHALDELELRRDRIRLERYYQRRGFPYVRVRYRIEEGRREWKKILTFSIDENTPVTVRDIRYVYNTSDHYREYITESSSYSRAQRRHDFQPGDRYQRIREPDVIGTLSDALENLGFAHAEVGIDVTIDTARSAASVQLTLDPGPLTYIDQVRVQGAETVSGDYVVREAGLQTGQRFRLGKLQEGQREIFNHHLFRFATISIPSQEQDSTLDLNITVRENSLRSLQARAGVGSEEILRGNLSWTHRNVFYSGHRFTASGRASFIEQSLNMDYLIPYVFNTRSSIVFSPFIQHILERNIFELFHGGITNSFIYRYRENLTGTASYQFTRNLELTQQLDETLPDTTFEYDLSSFQFSGYYSPGFTSEQEGWVVQPYLEFSGLFGAASFSFRKVSMDIRRFTRLSPTTILAARVHAGSIMNVEQDSLPQNIRYYLGGTSSVRGWTRNELGPKRVLRDSTGNFERFVPTGGRAVLGFNAEIRQEMDSFIRGFGMAFFVDGGQVWTDPKQLDARPVQFGVGSGLRYRSPIGPIRVDVGYKVNPTDADLDIYRGEDFGGRLSRFEVHFSVGQAL